MSSDNNIVGSRNAFVQTVLLESGLSAAGTVIISLIVPYVSSFRLQSTSAVFNYNVSFLVGHGTTYSSATEGYNSVTNSLIKSVITGSFTFTLQMFGRQQGSILE